MTSSPEAMSVIAMVKSTREDLAIQTLQADPSACDAVDDEGRTALHWAAEFGYTRLAHHLVNVDMQAVSVGVKVDTGMVTSQQGSDANVVRHTTDDKVGSTRFTKTNGVIVGLLDRPDDKGQTALHVACNARRAELATLLVTMGAELSTADENGNTPLHRAVRNNLDTTAALMCECGADVNARNDVLWTPLHEATRTGNASLLQVLIKHGADTNAITNNRMSPFLTAFFYYKIASKGSSYPNLDVIWKTLIEAGCQLSQSDGHWTPLTAAMACDNTFIAALLLFNGCRLDRKGGRVGRGLLQETFSCGEPMLVKLLVLLGYLPSPDEVTYCMKQLPMYSRVFTRLAGMASGLHRDRQTVVTWLRERAQQPPSLSEWCRVSVRRALSVSAGDQSIVANISALPLPNKLKRFLAMEDFTHYLCE